MLKKLTVLVLLGVAAGQANTIYEALVYPEPAINISASKEVQFKVSHRTIADVTVYGVLPLMETCTPAPTVFDSGCYGYASISANFGEYGGDSLHYRVYGNYDWGWQSNDFVWEYNCIVCQVELFPGRKYFLSAYVDAWQVGQNLAPISGWAEATISIPNPEPSACLLTALGLLVLATWKLRYLRRPGNPTKCKPCGRAES